MYLFRSLPLLAAVFSALTAPALAESRLVFPRLTFEANTFTGVAIVNPAGAGAVVTFTAYGSDGQLIVGDETFRNPSVAPDEIPAGGTFAQTTAGIFGNLPADLPAGAWFEASSPTDGLTGFFLFQNFLAGQDPQITFFDGSDLPPIAQQIVFNNVRHDEDFTTELNLINPGESQANLQLRLTVGSTLISELPMPLAGRAAARLDVSEFFDLATPIEEAAAVVVTSGPDAPIAGFQFVRGPGGELLGLNARPISETANVLYFPQLAVRDPFTTEIGVVNYSSEPVFLTISAHRPDGSLYVAEIMGENPVVRALPGNGVFREDAAQMFGFGPGPLLDGWIRVISTSQTVNGFVSYAIPGTGSLAAVAFSEARTRALISHIATSLGFFTGVAMLNPGSLSANVRVLALDENGDSLGSFNTVLRPRERVSMLITELIPASAGRARGLIWVRSNFPIYLTSLFGTVGEGGLPRTLANIPAQPSPDGFAPDAGLELLEVSPLLAFVAPGAPQQFQITGGTGTPIWMVDGGPTFGTIDSGAEISTYTAPGAVPDPLPIVVTAERTEGLAAGSVDILDPVTLFDEVGLVQSVAYLDGLQRLFTAELRLQAGGLLRGPVVQASDIVAIESNGTRNIVQSFPGDDIPKILPFLAVDSNEYLLLAVPSSNRIVRLDPETGATRDVVTSINEPTAMAFDAIGDLLVAVDEAEPFRTIPRILLENDLTPPAAALQANRGQVSSSRIEDHKRARTSRGEPRLLDPFGSEYPVSRFSANPTPAESAPSRRPLPSSPSGRGRTLFQTASTTMERGIAFDVCTNDVYLSRPELGTIERISGESQKPETVANGLVNPGQLLGFHRQGIDCPRSFQLLVAEKGANRVVILSPGMFEAQTWVEAPAPTDVLFLTGDNPFLTEESVLVPGADQPFTPRGPQPASGVISSVSVPDLYDPLPPNPPGTCQGLVTFPDPGLAFAVRQALDLGPTDLITCQAAQQIEVLDAPGLQIQSLEGIQFLTALQALFLEGNLISDLTPISGLTSLIGLDLRSNLITDISALSGLTALQVVDLTFNGVSDLSPVAGLDNMLLFAAGANSIVDISPLVNLTQMTVLGLGENAIRDIGILEGFTQLNLLQVRDNQITNIRALVDNPGLGQGDTVDILRNRLDQGDCPDIFALIERGVLLVTDAPCN